MKKFTLTCITAFALLASKQTKAQTLIHYWNFNNNSSIEAITTPNISITNPSQITYSLGTTSEFAFANGTGQNFDVLNLNARNNDLAGTHLRFNNPIGGQLIFNLSTLGYENPVVKFATRRSGSGAGTQTWTYSTDGVTFIPFDIINVNDDNPSLQTLDFSSIANADNNVNFKVKVEFSEGNGGIVGNNRFDNFTLEAYPIGTTPTPTPKIAFENTMYVFEENAGTVTLNLNIQNQGANGTVDLILKPTPFSTADSNDHSFVSQTITLDENTTSTHQITFTINDDDLEEQQAEYFVLSLENPNNVIIDGNPFTTVYIKDNDRLAPIPSNEITLDYVGSFDPSGANNSSTEIVVHDPISQRLFTTSGVSGILDIIDFSNPLVPTVIESINMASYGGITSVAVKNGMVAVASPNLNETENGSVVFFDTNGTFINQVTVGVLPDNIVFTPDGTKVLTANEGQPNEDYSIDPEGSISIINVSNGLNNINQSNVTTLDFTQFNTQEAALIANGIRKTKSTSTFSQDLEPEYIAVDSSSEKAWVTLQENNTIAEINLTNLSITNLWALGTKDMSLPGNGFDASDNNNHILIANWPVQSYYIPDAVATFKVNDVNYIVTANEGDEKEYGDFEERIAVNSNNYNLDSTIFPHAEFLKQSHNLGRFRATNLNGDIDNDGNFEVIHSVGSRSFSIFNADTQTLIFDSGDDFEMYTAENYPSIFNSDHESNNIKNRSRSKGPEPEGVTIATIDDQIFALIALERIGGVMVYNVTDPNNVTFVDYKNNRSTSAYSGDHGAESLIYISPENSPNNKAYVIVANEVSGTLTIYEVNSPLLSNDTFEPLETKTFNIFPNPSKGEVVYFNREASIIIFDLNGKVIDQQDNALSINISKYKKGIYIIKTKEGLIQKLIVN